MNLIIIYPGDFVDRGMIRLTGNRFDHIRTVLKANRGAVIRVGLINGNTGEGRLIEYGNQECILNVSLEDSPPPALPVTLICALPRPKTLKKLLQSTVAMGVKRFYLIRTRRVDKSYWHSPLLREENLRKQCILGLEQSRDTVVPVIEKRLLFKPFVEDELPQLIAGTHALAAHPSYSPSGKPDVDKPLTVAIGPEGGFIPYEIDLLKKIGFETFSLGPRPLRVEYAATALLAKLL